MSCLGLQVANEAMDRNMDQSYNIQVGRDLYGGQNVRRQRNPHHNMIPRDSSDRLLVVW